MQFLLQTINGKVTSDFGFELERAQEYYAWKGEDLHILPSDKVLKEVYFKDYIPVGTVEFVSEFLKAHYPKAEAALYPINVPQCLFPYAKRRIEDCFTTDTDMFTKGEEIYRKSVVRLKDPSNGKVVYKSFMDVTGYQISEVVDIESEWRVFVFNGRVMHCACYAGDPLWFPDAYEIGKMVEDYENAPKAYTLDVGVGKVGTFVIEVHRFFSCGLYGFSDYEHYPKMLSQEWFEVKNMK